MAITTAICNSFKQELPVKGHDFTLSTGDSFKAALYLNSATLDATTATYTATGEVADGGGYTTTGQACTNITPALDGNKSHWQFQDVTWAASSITARGCMFYNDTDANKASVSVHDFGSDQTSSNGDFTLVMPVNNGTTGLYRIA